MGNQQTGMCTGCSTAGMTVGQMDFSQAIVPSEEELVAYLHDVKNYVVGSLESEEARFKRYLEAFKPKSANLRLCADAFKQELEIGLNCHHKHPFTHVPEECSFKMFDSFVPRAPTGKESGVFYALDFGGTNFRVVRCEFDHGKIRTTQKKASLADAHLPYPKGMLDQKATATQMFDFFAQVVEDFMRESGDIESRSTIPLGFTFSYPCMAKSVLHASLLVWTKGFETGRATDDPVEGSDGSELMNQALIRKHLPVRVNCIANDTVGTLLSCAYSMPHDVPPCHIGLILGTGMNACYIDPDSKRYSYSSNIINIECGNFNVRSLPRTNVDHELDFDDVGGRGRQHLEKMCSGAYLGELCRRTLVKIFQANAPPLMWQVDTLTSEDASYIIQDKSESMAVVQKKVHECWNAQMKPEHLKWVKEICEMVFRRAAAMAAVIIAGCAMKTGRLQEAMGGLTCGIDGSLYKMNQFFRDDVEKYLVEVLGQKQAALINLTFADDGSGLGAAVLSAVVEHDSNPHKQVEHVGETGGVGFISNMHAPIH